MTRQEVLEHLKSRGMNPYLYDLCYDEETITFPLYNLAKRQTGYQVYRPGAPRITANVRDARYFTYLPKGVNGYFGVESLEYTGKLYIVEGVFKAAVLHRLGYASLAVMGSEGKHVKNQVFILSQLREIEVIGDNDAAGKKFADQFNGRVSPYDLDEMPDEHVKEFLDRA